MVIIQSFSSQSAGSHVQEAFRPGCMTKLYEPELPLTFPYTARGKKQPSSQARISLIISHNEKETNTDESAWAWSPVFRLRNIRRRGSLVFKYLISAHGVSTEKLHSFYYPIKTWQRCISFCLLARAPAEWPNINTGSPFLFLLESGRSNPACWFRSSVNRVSLSFGTHSHMAWGERLMQLAKTTHPPPESAASRAAADDLPCFWGGGLTFMFPLFRRDILWRCSHAGPDSS